MNKLFVSGFPLEITEMELALLIAPFGDIDTIKIVRDKKTKKCKGYAFIEMKSPEGAVNAAEELNGKSMKGRELTVNINPEPGEDTTSDAKQKRDTSFVPQAAATRMSPRIVQSDTERPKRPRRTRL